MRKFIILLSLLIALIFTGCELINDWAMWGIDGEFLSADLNEDEYRFSRVDGIECIPDISSFETARVTRVIDGDSIEVELDGEIYQVRYIGINTPEYYSKEQKRAVEATQANKNLVEGKTLYLFKDQSETDKYGRLLRYVLTSDEFVNLELVRAGYAQAKEYYPDTACHVVFDQAEP